MLILNNMELDINYHNYPKTGEITWLQVNIEDHLHIQIYENKELELPILEKYSPKPGDVIYIGPGCNIPRIKLKDLMINNAIKSTTNFNKATHLFIDTKFNAIVTNDWICLENSKNILEFFNLAKENKLIESEELEYIQNLVKGYSDDESIGIPSKFANRIARKKDPIYHKLNPSPLINIPSTVRNSNIDFIVAEYVDLYNFIQNNQDKLYNYKSLICHINSSDSITIDEKVFDQLSSMFNSEDADNHILAMEIMANSNYLDSLMYLEMLFCNHGNVINITKTKKHVNFKSLTDFLGKSTSNLDLTSCHDIIQSLIDKEVVTLEKVHYVFEKYKIQFYANTAHFSVKEVTLSDDLLKIVNKNYVNTVQEDYVPEEREEVEKEKSDEFSWIQ